MYKLGWILTFTAAAIIYYLLTFFVKLRVFPAGFEHMPLTFEYLAKDGRDGFFEGERVEITGAPVSPVLSDTDEVRIQGEKKVDKSST